MAAADPQPPDAAGGLATGGRAGVLVLAGPAVALVLVALCLRGPFAAVGPVTGQLGTEVGLGGAALAVLTALPLVCLGLVSPLAPVLAARSGVHRAVLTGAAAVVAGVLLRLAGAPGLFAGTVVLCGGIAICNVLLPAAARADSARHSATVVGLTTAGIGFSAALGAGLAQPLTAATGSAVTALALWAVPAGVAVVAIGLVARRREPAGAPPPARRGGGILRDPVALAVTGYFGLQSLGFYAMLTWLPAVLADDAGVSPVAAGGLVAVGAALTGPAALVVPPLAVRRPGQVPWVVGFAVPTAVALGGLLLAPSAAPALWALLYGIGTGGCLPVAMTLVLRRTRDVEQTGRLSAAAQTVGYLLAATGPLAVGLLHDVTGGWRTGLVLLLVLLALQVAVGVAAARPRLVRERPAAARGQKG
ncbi:MFS transporter [Trujillonella humicola]|uniref:MFS transporter n=1 Tax=Trujillonella humicola TaxID=3383699 RepID=UPI003906156F